MSLCCMPKINAMLYANYISVKNQKTSLYLFMKKFPLKKKYQAIVTSLYICKFYLNSETHKLNKWL